MTTAMSRASNNKIGTCPHGLPLGACPICNGMGGGGSVKKDNKPREMSWNECYAIGQMLKAQKQAKIHTQQMFAAQTMQARLENLQTQINAFKLAVLNSSLPKPIINTVVTILDNVVMPTIKMVQKIANTLTNVITNINKVLDNIKQKIADISEKLTAVLGEAKAFVEKKISDSLKNIKKKVFNLLGLNSTENEEDEEIKKLEEKKQIEAENTTKETFLLLTQTPYEQENESNQN